MDKNIKRKRLNRSWYGDTLIFLMLGLMGIFMALPLYLSIINSLKPMEELFIFPPKFYVIHPSLDSFRQMFQLTSNLWVPFSRYLFNSVFVCSIATVGQIFFASMAAYIFAKHKFPGSNIMYQTVLLALLFTGGTMALPQYIVMAKLHMINTYWAIILPMIASSLGLFLMRQFIALIPDAMLEAARIDGANEFTIYWNIIMPNVKSAWLTLLIFAFKDIWHATGGNFIYSESLKLLPAALRQIATGSIARTGAGAAVTVLLMLPPLIIFIVTQSNVIETMAHSGMKD